MLSEDLIEVNHNINCDFKCTEVVFYVQLEMSASDQLDATDSSTERRDIHPTDEQRLPSPHSSQELTKNQKKKMARRQKLLEKMKANRLETNCYPRRSVRISIMPML